MAEYLAGNADGLPEDEEDEIDYNEDNSEGEDGDGELQEPAPPAILKGALSIAGEGDKKALIYTGTWSYGVDSTDAWKFKLKSPIVADFNFTKPAASYTFSGYFIIPDDAVPGGKSKILEQEVRFNFKDIEGKHFGKRWTVEGSGANQFGTFKLNGEYRCKASPENKMNVEKKYDAVATGGAESDSADEDFDDDDKADEDELAALKADAELSQEELYKRSYGDMASIAEGEGEAKKQKTEEKPAGEKPAEEKK
eukprot:CAMPEP_0118652620 /NCGR_PEP_ID=MMETSP0785-20121206/11411_1 /TAXON_ID=91992 /ORGANISM="Bolidomonas pacifica, Strain CCMP 1866" /LENGTH=252 /DNA_ID=CAMNT_0006545141 /DNA_START=22 /DNA_END=777 /DNA_ORIENTATION=+